MARLRQQHPQNYVNSGNIHTDFENVIRYLNTAELGDKTVAELMATIFNEEGVFDGPIQMRLDATAGIQYRIGQYSGAETGWVTIADVSTFRGTAGASVGNVEGPFFFGRADVLIGGPIATLTVTAGGANYATVPTVTISDPQEPTGTTATATATLTADAVTAITITDAGSGYTAAPTVTITGGSGSGATATGEVGAANSVLGYSFDPSTENIVVYRNGLLLHDTTTASTAAQYTFDTSANTITLATASPAVALGDKISIYSIRAQSVTNFRRVDNEISGSTTLVSFVHTDDEKILVWRNGILQQPGGSADYLSSSTSDTITFVDTSNQLTTGDKVTIMTVENQSLKTVAGMMFEDEYTNASGYINYAKVAVQDDEIPQAKVSALANTLTNKANLVSQSQTPTSPATGDLWLDTSLAPAILKFYEGTQWLETSPESSLPTFVQTNANQYVRVNGTGTGLQYGDIDFSSVVPKTYMGAANGVATLDSSGNLPVTQLPETFSTVSIPFFSVHEDSSANIGNKTYYLSRIWKQTIRIDGIAYKLSSGTATLQLSVDGVAVGSTYSATSSLQSDNIATVIEIDATVASKRIELVVTNNSSGQSLEVVIAAATVNV
tara:strand:- start:90 stop:1922 length:1833 start_codon:yes stop_codon:yes gene_type:complete